MVSEKMIGFVTRIDKSVMKQMAGAGEQERTENWEG